MIVKLPCSAVLWLLLMFVLLWWSLRGRGWVLFGVDLEHLSEPVEAELPGGALPGEPVRGQVQPDGLEPAGAGAARFLGADQPTGLEDGQVLQDGGERHVEGPGELADRGRACAEAFDQVTTGGVAQGPEDLVEGLILKHQLNY